MLAEMDNELWSPIEDDGFIALVWPILMRRDFPGRFRFVAEPRHKNSSGFVEGGMLMTFADRAMGMTARDGRQVAISNVQMNTQFMQPARIGDMVDIHCSTVRRTRTLIFVEAKLTVGDEIIASASGIWKIIGKPERAA